ncbi:MAG TPA: hypothetical protein VEJ23_08470 [Solirubrobacteraceae bacterium]|nr:hypothetical protein [Solirubrobacteraceae bacterium]
MARIMVTTGSVGSYPDASTNEASVLLDERVEPIHLSEDQAARQLIERIAWAVADAQDDEHAP